MQEPLFKNLLHLTAENAFPNDEERMPKVDLGMQLIEQVGAAQSLDEAASAVARSLAGKLVDILSPKENSFDASQPIPVYGFDSLVAVELRNWFLKAANADVAVFEMLSGATTESLGRRVVEKMLAGASS
jgi:hypothetical protein